MRRYRVARFMIDGTRETLTNEKIPAEHKEHIIERIKERHGTDDHEAKLKRYLDLKPPNFMVVPDYVNLLNEIRDSYVSGYLYAALTASCCLGERILNTLIISLRDYDKKRRQYKWAISRTLGTFPLAPGYVRRLHHGTNCLGYHPAP